MPPTTMAQRLAVFGLGVCALLTIYSTQPVLAVLAAEFGVGEGRSAWTVSATPLGVALVAPLAGSISDRAGRKRVMTSAIAALTVVTLGCAAAWNLESLLVFRFAQGLAIPFVFTAAVAYVAEEWRDRGSPTMTGIYVAGTAFGGFCGRFASGVATEAAGWRSTFLVLAAILLLVLAAVARWLPRERRFTPAATTFGGVRMLRTHLRDARLAGTCAVGACLLFLQVAAFTYAGLHLLDAPFGLTPAQVGSVFAVFLVAVVVTPVAGWLVARAGRVVTYVVTTVMAVTGLALTVVPAITAVVVGLALSCTAVFAGQACATGFAASRGRTSRSSAVGLYLSAYYLGGSVGGVAPAPLYASSGWTACVILLGAVTLVSLVIAVLSWRRPPAARAP